MLRILVTNDDGIRSEGIRALAGAVAHLGDVTVVAPMGEASAIGHALTLTRPLRLEEVDDRWFAVDGTPTDCVNIAVSKVLSGRPDLILSGINKGYNIGDDVTYSGTVAGAMEGALLGVPAIAVSQCRVPVYDFTQAAAAARIVAEAVVEHGLAPRMFLNVNVPPVAMRGYKTTVQARRNHMTPVLEGVDPRGRPYFWISEAEYEWVHDERSDFHAVRQGFVSVTPLLVDLTSHEHLALVEGLSLPVEVGVDS